MDITTTIENMMPLERLLIDSLGWRRGVLCTNDGSRPHTKFGANGRSALWTRTYLVFLDTGKPVAFSRAVKIKFVYDERQGSAQLRLPNGSVDSLVARLPGLANAVTHGVQAEGGPLVQVKRLDAEECELEVTCPRCGKAFTHRCFGGQA